MKKGVGSTFMAAPSVVKPAIESRAPVVLVHQVRPSLMPAT
jgi:hypothetical protein